MQSLPNLYHANRKSANNHTPLKTKPFIAFLLRALNALALVLLQSNG